MRSGANRKFTVTDAASGTTPVDADRGQTLPVGTAVDVDDPALVTGQSFQHRPEFVDGIVAQPGSGGMGPGAGRRDDDPQSALAAGLDIAAGGLTEDGDVRAQPVRHLAFDAPQSVGCRLDLLAVVEHQRDVVNGFGDGGGQMQEHRVPGLHIRGAAPPEVVGVATGRKVAVDGHGVEVAGQDHPGRPAQVGTGQHRISVADHLVAGLVTQRALDLVGDASFVPRHTRDVHERSGQVNRVGAKVQHS